MNFQKRMLGPLQMNSLELLCVSVKLLHVFALTVLPSNICDCSSDADKEHKAELSEWCWDNSLLHWFTCGKGVFFPQVSVDYLDVCRWGFSMCLLGKILPSNCCDAQHVMQTKDTRQWCLTDLGTRSLSFNLEQSLVHVLLFTSLLKVFLHVGFTFGCVCQCCSVTQSLWLYVCQCCSVTQYLWLLLKCSQRTNSSVVGAYRIDQRLRLDTKKCSYAKEFDWICIEIRICSYQDFFSFIASVQSWQV